MSADSLKAFAHPLRMQLYSQLQNGGPATASQLGRALGESSGQTSYHLRQLERHGFVEDDPAHSGGRERWWRAVGFNMDSLELLRDPATAGSAQVVLQQTVSERAGALTAWVNALDLDDPVWTGMLSSSTVSLTAEEFEEITGALMAMLEERLEPMRGRTLDETPEGTRRVRFHVDAFPLVGGGMPSE
ncbi:winged helix-turn-helix domain-containing protein [Serinibacter arcticus]|nr:helix-turn-helix domain-containing protein [Serinibacter arcticus]